jgi:hypothetical protein
MLATATWLRVDALFHDRRIERMNHYRCTGFHDDGTATNGSRLLPVISEVHYDVRYLTGYFINYERGKRQEELRQDIWSILHIWIRLLCPQAAYKATAYLLKRRSGIFSQCIKHRKQSRMRDSVRLPEHLVKAFLARVKRLVSSPWTQDPELHREARVPASMALARSDSVLICN